MRIRIKATVEHTLPKGKTMAEFKEDMRKLFPGTVINLAVKELTTDEPA
jgi:hypothetical protein